MTKEYIIAGATEPVYVNETGTRQEILATVYLNETWVNKRFFKKKVVRTKQPQTPMPIDRSNPLAHGLSHFWGIRSGAKLLDSAGNVSGSLGTTVALSASPQGMVLKATGADNADSNASPVGGTGSASAAIGQTFSIFARIKVGAIYQNNPIYASLDGGVQFRISSVMGLGATTTSYAPGNSTTAVDGTKFVDVGVSYDGTTVRYYLDGVADGTSTWSFSSFDQTVQHYIGGDIGNDESLSQNTEIAFVGIYKEKILSAEQFKQLAENPWQLFEPEKRVKALTITPAAVTPKRFFKKKVTRTKQPQDIVTIDRSNLFGKRAISIVVGTDNYIRGINQFATIAGTPLKGTNKDGSVLIANTNGAFLRKDNLTSREKPTEITVFWRGSVTTGAVTNTPILSGIIYDTLDSAPYSCASICRTSTDSVMFIWSDNGTFRSKTVVGAFITDEIATFVLTVKNGDVRFYKNGKEITTFAVTASVVTYSSSSFFAVGSGYANLSINANSKTSLAGYLDGALSFDEVEDLTNNPWQLFEPEYRTLAITKVTAPVGGATYNQSVSGILASAGAMVRSIDKSVSGGLAKIGTTIKQTAKTVIGGLAHVGSTIKQTAKTVIGGLAHVGSTIKQTAKTVVGGLAKIGTMIKSVGKVVAGSLSLSAILSAIKTALVSIGGSLSFVGSSIKTVGKAVLGSLSSSGTIIKTINKVLAGTLSFIGAVGTSTSGYIQQAVGGALSFSGTSTKAITKILVGALTTSGEAVKSVRKVIVGSLSLSGILNSVRVLIRAIGGSLSMAGSTVKSVGKTVAGNLANAGTVVRSVRSNIVGSLSTSGTAIKSVGKTIAGSLSFAAIVAAALNVILYFISKITFSKRARSMTFTAAKRTITFTRKI